jgi:hypothetical protein
VAPLARRLAEQEKCFGAMMREWTHAENGNVRPSRSSSIPH